MAMNSNICEAPFQTGAILRNVPRKFTIVRLVTYDYIILLGYLKWSKQFNISVSSEFGTIDSYFQDS